MPLFYLITLAVVQGITEFLPISSSGHLILLPTVLDMPDQGRAVDVAAHVGTLIAVCLYFRRDIARMITPVIHPITAPSPDKQLLIYLILASLPAVLAGGVIFILDWDIMRSSMVVGWATIIFGVLLGLADRMPATRKELGHKTVIIIGLAQILALIPGTSRSGITMTAGRVMKLSRGVAARFSMLMAIPIIILAGLAESYAMWQSGQMAVITDMIIVAVLSAITAMMAIHGLLAWLKRAGFMPFVIYRIAMGVAILLYF
jgi:undecaprenyl-diphosphatase